MCNVRVLGFYRPARSGFDQNPYITQRKFLGTPCLPTFTGQLQQPVLVYVPVEPFGQGGASSDLSDRGCVLSYAI
jgi:hypothetical protein